MEREYVGVDLHRRRSVIYRMDQVGERLDCVRVANEPAMFAAAVSAAPVGSDVIIEASYGWYWAADLLAEVGYRVHLANPHGNDWGHRRVKNDERDARDLADLLRLGRLAEAWIAPPDRERRGDRCAMARRKCRSPPTRAGFGVREMNQARSFPD
jgi:transposase